MRISSLSFKSKSNVSIKYARKFDLKKICIIYQKKGNKKEEFSASICRLCGACEFQGSRLKLNSSGLWLLRVARKLSTLEVFSSLDEKFARELSTSNDGKALQYLAVVFLAYFLAIIWKQWFSLVFQFSSLDDLTI